MTPSSLRGAKPGRPTRSSPIGVTLASADTTDTTTLGQRATQDHLQAHTIRPTTFGHSGPEPREWSGRGQKITESRFGPFSAFDHRCELPRHSRGIAAAGSGFAVSSPARASAGSRFTQCWYNCETRHFTCKARPFGRRECRISASSSSRSGAASPRTAGAGSTIRCGRGRTVTARLARMAAAASLDALRVAGATQGSISYSYSPGHPSGPRRCPFADPATGLFRQAGRNAWRARSPGVSWGTWFPRGVQGGAVAGTRFVMVHGAWHGGWCSDAVAASCARAGTRSTRWTCPVAPTRPQPAPRRWRTPSPRCAGPSRRCPGRSCSWRTAWAASRPPRSPPASRSGSHGSGMWARSCRATGRASATSRPPSSSGCRSSRGTRRSTSPRGLRTRRYPTRWRRSSRRATRRSPAGRSRGWSRRASRSAHTRCRCRTARWTGWHGPTWRRCGTRRFPSPRSGRCTPRPGSPTWSRSTPTTRRRRTRRARWRTRPAPRGPAATGPARARRG